MIAKKFIFLSLLVFSLFRISANPPTSCQHHLHQSNIIKLLNGPMKDPIQYRYAIEFLQQLQPLPSNHLEQNLPWLWSTDAQLNQLEAQWNQVFKGEFQETLEITLHVDQKRKEPHIVMLGTLFNKDKQPIGFFGRTLYWKKTNRAEAWGNGMYFVVDNDSPRSRGISKYVHLFLDSLVYPKLNITREGLEADYLGRHLWAKKGYYFDEEVIFTEHASGQQFTLREICQRNFLRFLDKFKIDISELVLEISPAKLVPLTSVELLQQPYDYLTVKHKDGKKIKLAPLLGYRTVGTEEEYEVGLAFMNADYHRYDKDKGNLGISTPPYLPILDYTMPYWVGYVDVTKRSSEK